MRTFDWTVATFLLLVYVAVVVSLHAFHALGH